MSDKKRPSLNAICQSPILMSVTLSFVANLKQGFVLFCNWRAVLSSSWLWILWMAFLLVGEDSIAGCVLSSHRCTSAPREPHNGPVVQGDPMMPALPPNSTVLRASCLACYDGCGCSVQNVLRQNSIWVLLLSTEWAICTLIMCMWKYIVGWLFVYVILVGRSKLFVMLSWQSRIPRCPE